MFEAKSLFTKFQLSPIDGSGLVQVIRYRTLTYMYGSKFIQLYFLIQFSFLNSVYFAFFMKVCSYFGCYYILRYIELFTKYR